ncbi:hypothetical protein BDB01DRAFT_803510 [Pilobolus umbonatus]|nr:hypothetical protein BDB01DRAFT_803510 [Pilobolus umbonatus]
MLSIQGLQCFIVYFILLIFKSYLLKHLPSIQIVMILSNKHKLLSTIDTLTPFTFALNYESYLVLFRLHILCTGYLLYPGNINSYHIGSVNLAVMTTGKMGHYENLKYGI